MGPTKARRLAPRSAPWPESFPSSRSAVTKKGKATYQVPGSTYEAAFAFFAKMNAAKKEWAKV